MTHMNYLLATLVLLSAGVAQAGQSAEAARQDPVDLPPKDMSTRLETTAKVDAVPKVVDPKVSEQTAASSVSAKSKHIYRDGGYYGGDQ